MGGWSTYHPNFHGCGDTVANMDLTNILRSTQQNLAVGLNWGPFTSSYKDVIALVVLLLILLLRSGKLAAAERAG